MVDSSGLGPDQVEAAAIARDCDWDQAASAGWNRNDVAAGHLYAADLQAEAGGRETRMEEEDENDRFAGQRGWTGMIAQKGIHEAEAHFEV